MIWRQGETRLQEGISYSNKDPRSLCSRHWCSQQDRLPEAVFIIQYQLVWLGLHNSSFHSVERGKLILSPWLLDKWQMISSMSQPPPPLPTAVLAASHLFLSLFYIHHRILTHQKLFWLVDLTTPPGLSWPYNQIWQYFFSFTREDKRTGFVFKTSVYFSFGLLCLVI